MYAHEYICFFTKYEYFMYFLIRQFFNWFFVGFSPVSGLVHILGFASSMTGPVPITLVRMHVKKKPRNVVTLGYLEPYEVLIWHS